MTDKKTIILAALLASQGALTATAQVTPRLSGPRHAMVTVDSDKRYLLLPVEEKEENAHIRIIRNGQLVQTLNCRLATDKTDYWVPLEVERGTVLHIAFAGNTRSTGAVADFTCWKKMSYSDTFDTTNREPLRPAYHHTPAYGWMNDPNGMFYKDGTWHVYYQWNPYGSMWENMTWGHSTSKDLIHWTAEPAAIEADALGTVFSGSAVVDTKNTAGFGPGAVVAFYTAAGMNQTQAMAYSTDNGKTFTKYEGNPVVTAEAPDFRDPKVIWHEETHRWVMVLAVGQEMQFFSSANLKDWKFESSFGREYGNHGGVWECPDLLRMKVEDTGEEKWMLFCNINPGGPAGGSATQYFTGSFDGHRFTCESKPSVTKWMDYGKDHYATVTFSGAPDGRHVALGWMSNWQYANQVPTMQYRSANTIARDLGLYNYNGETYCSVRPAKEMLAARGKALSQPSECCEIVADVKGDCQLTLKNGKGEWVTIVWNADDRTLYMDRLHAGNGTFSDNFPVITSAPAHGQVNQLRIFIDHSSIEVFDAEGRVAMTNLVFPSEAYNRLVVKGKAKTKIYAINH